MQKRGNFSFLNKKGTLITRQMIIHLGMLGLLALVYFLLDAYVDSIRQDAEFEMLFLSRDIAMLTNTLYSAPGEVSYTYSLDKLGAKFELFKFEFTELSNLDDKPVVKVEGYEHMKIYPYARPYQNKDTYLISEVNSIKFSKSGSKLTITKNE